MSPAVGMSDHQRMLHWQNNGAVSRDEMCDLSSQVTDDGHDVADRFAGRTAELKEQLMSDLESDLETVDADKPSPKLKSKRRN
jgi:hypothetical protein